MKTRVEVYGAKNGRISLDVYEDEVKIDEGWGY